MKYQKTKLINGSTLAVVQVPSYAVTISAYIKAGFRFDPLKKPGLAHFVEHMLFSGTKKYPTHRGLAFAIERFGGWHSAYTWVDFQSHYVHLPRKYFKNGVDVLFETLYSSFLIDEEVKKERGRVKEEILRNISDPEKAVIPQVWFPLFFQSTRLGRSYFGSLEDIEQISRIDVVQFYNSYIRSGEKCFIVAGDISLSESQETMNNYLKKYKVHDTEINMPLLVKKSLKLRVAVRNTESDYVSLTVGIPTTSLYIHDRHVLKILINILARDFGARLPDRLRDQGGLVYTCHALQENFIDNGYIYFKTSSHKMNVGKIIVIIIQEFQRLAQNDISAKEIETAKGNLIGSLLSNMQTGLDYVEWYGMQELYALNPVLHIEDQIRIYRSISKKDILAVARKYFLHDQIYIAAYGNIQQQEIEKLL